MTATGSTYRRCSCRDPNTGRSLGSACPKLSRRRHGICYYRLELPPDAAGLRRPRRRGGFTTQTDAQAELDHARALLAIPPADDRHAVTTVGDLLEKAIGDGHPLPTTEEVRRRLHTGLDADELPTVGAWLTGWLAGRRTIKRNTVRSYEAHIRLHLVPNLGPIRIDRLRPGHIADMVDAIGERNDRVRAARASHDPNLRGSVRGMRPVGPATLHRIRATLRKALNDAIRQQLIGANPAVHVELPSGRRPKPIVWTDEHVARWAQTGQPPSAVMVWTPEQTGRFLDAAADDPLYPLFHLIAFRGLRRGEACGLHWTDLDLTIGTLTVRWQLLQYGWETGLDDPKTEASADVIALDTATAAVLSEHRDRQDAQRLAAGGHWPDTGLVFTTPAGHRLHPANVTDHFTHLAAAAGLPPIRLHDLRHGAATLTLASGADMKIVSQLLRHSSITITADTYTSVLPQVARDAAEKAAALVPRARARTLGLPSGAQQTTKDTPATAERSSETTKDQVNSGADLVSECGAPGDRTQNPRIKSPLLCQLS